MQSESKDPSAHIAQHANFSLERISRLVSDLEQELSMAPDGSPRLDALREEIANLKHTLAKSDEPAHDIEEKLHAMRRNMADFAASVEGEVLKESRYLAELGRILGLV
jgi:predicted  nucleic acid-binding Zn-ribbon protein